MTGPARPHTDLCTGGGACFTVCFADDFTDACRCWCHTLPTRWVYAPSPPAGLRPGIGDSSIINNGQNAHHRYTPSGRNAHMDTYDPADPEPEPTSYRLPTRPWWHNPITITALTGAFVLLVAGCVIYLIG